MEPLTYWIEQAAPMRGAPRVCQLEVSVETWQQLAREIAADGGRLLALWADCEPAATVHAAFLTRSVVLVLSLAVPESSASYPGLAELFPAAVRMQRTAADLCGVRSDDFDTRPWLRHAAWPTRYCPLASERQPFVKTEAVSDEYRFVRVTGDGVHEIP
jgi:Ni,Fe-hydrogenase III component G